MYDSVEKYGGYYISRYEIGLDNVTKREDELVTDINKIYSQMGKMPYTNIGWCSSEDIINEKGGTVEVARSLYKRDSIKYGVASTLTYGVQWDAALQWLIDSGVTSNVDKNTWGNYMVKPIGSGEINSGARYADAELKNVYNVEYDATTLESITTKNESTILMFSTGAIKDCKKNNIYDMAGNASEWVMEGVSTTMRSVRGGACNTSFLQGASRRDGTTPNKKVWHIGFRTALYIK